MKLTSPTHTFERLACFSLLVCIMVIALNGQPANAQEDTGERAIPTPTATEENSDAVIVSALRGRAIAALDQIDTALVQRANSIAASTTLSDASQNALSQYIQQKRAAIDGIQTDIENAETVEEIQSILVGAAQTLRGQSSSLQQRRTAIKQQLSSAHTTARTAGNLLVSKFSAAERQLAAAGVDTGELQTKILTFERSLSNLPSTDTAAMRTALTTLRGQAKDILDTITQLSESAAE